jgi:hypothetical protein
MNPGKTGNIERRSGYMPVWLIHLVTIDVPLAAVMATAVDLLKPFVKRLVQRFRR